MNKSQEHLADKQFFNSQAGYDTDFYFIFYMRKSWAHFVYRQSYNRQPILNMMDIHATDVSTCCWNHLLMEGWLHKCIEIDYKIRPRGYKDVSCDSFVFYIVLEAR